MHLGIRQWVTLMAFVCLCFDGLYASPARRSAPRPPAASDAARAEDAPGSAAEAREAMPLVSRRVITKIDGVIVEERDMEAVAHDELPAAKQLPGKEARHSPPAEVEEEGGPVAVPIVPPGEPSMLQPSPNLVLGRIVSVNQSGQTAVAWMQSRFISLERPVVTRNHELNITARLAPSPYRNGLAYGLEVLDGLPSIGDEVVLPERSMDEE